MPPTYLEDRSFGPSFAPSGVRVESTLWDAACQYPREDWPLRPKWNRLNLGAYPNRVRREMTEQEVAAEMADYAAQYDPPPTDEEMERQYLLNAQATPPELRDRDQWAALGFPMGPPIYARGDE